MLYPLNALFITTLLVLPSPPSMGEGTEADGNKVLYCHMAAGIELRFVGCRAYPTWIPDTKLDLKGKSYL